MQILNWNNIDLLKQLPDNSVDSIVTDPPYWLSFMGKKWDYDVPTVELWKECLRVLKPWGHLLAFAWTRTQHRMAVRIEDAGFEIRDMIAWVYGSGFPKSLNIWKAVDKLEGNEREVILNPKAKQQTQAKDGIYGDYEATTTISKWTSEREWRWTALKPAIEPITLARKPLWEKTIVENVLKYGTGGINIDESRVEGTYDNEGRNIRQEDYKSEAEFLTALSKEGRKTRSDSNSLGRFPANLIHDNSEEVRECFPESKSGGAIKEHKRDTSNINFANHCQEWEGFNDSGNASRFFKSIIYQAKASKAERNMGCGGLDEKKPAVFDFRPTLETNRENRATPIDETPYWRGWEMKNNHPTVKPIALMEYLIKMVTKKWWIVLDPFMWSWTTGIAAKKNWYNFIWMEMDEWYHKIAEARINAVEETKEREVSLFSV